MLGDSLRVIFGIVHAHIPVDGNGASFLGAVFPNCNNTVFRYAYVMRRSHIYGSPRRFHYGSNLMYGSGNVIFHSPIRVHNKVTTGFHVSTKDKIVL